MSERLWIDGRAACVPEHEYEDFREDARMNDAPEGPDLIWRCYLCGTQDTVLEHDGGKMRCADGEACRQGQHDGGTAWRDMADQVEPAPDAPLIYGAEER